MDVLTGREDMDVQAKVRPHHKSNRRRMTTPNTQGDSWEEFVKEAVNRFLRWKLPEDFFPDGGISFTKVSNEDTDYAYTHEPIGTNLFTATQATEMVRHILDTSQLQEFLSKERAEGERRGAENMRAKVLEETKDLRRSVIRADKTPRYSYSNTKQARNAEGELPDGGRWKNAYELVDDHIHTIATLPADSTEGKKCERIGGCIGEGCLHTNEYKKLTTPDSTEAPLLKD
jgi:hypothetical protein